MTARPQIAQRIATGYRDPLARIDWRAVDRECWWLPPQALSLAGVAEFERLPLADRQRLSHYEFAHVLQTGLWLESLYIARLGAALERAEDEATHRRFLNAIREEAGHSLMFLELIGRTGVVIPNARRLRPRFAHTLTRFLSADSALFWLAVFAGEALPERLNQFVRRGVEEVTVSTVVYHMSRLHSSDEAEHIAEARRRCAEIGRRLRPWQRAAMAFALGKMIDAFAQHLFYPAAALYAAAGFAAPDAWRARALESPIRAEFVASALRPTLAFLRTQGFDVRTRHAH